MFRQTWTLLQEQAGSPGVFMSCLVQSNVSVVAVCCPRENQLGVAQEQHLREFWGITGLSQPQGLGLGSKATSLSVFSPFHLSHAVLLLSACAFFCPAEPDGRLTAALRGSGTPGGHSCWWRWSVPPKQGLSPAEKGFLFLFLTRLLLPDIQETLLWSPVGAHPVAESWGALPPHPSPPSTEHLGRVERPPAAASI